jgi:hypothetical protein
MPLGDPEISGFTVTRTYFPNSKCARGSWGVPIAARLEATAADIVLWRGSRPPAASSITARGPGVGGAHRVLMAVAEMRSHIVDDGGDLVVVEHEAHGRHALRSAHHDADGVAAGRELLVIR